MIGIVAGSQIPALIVPHQIQRIAKKKNPQAYVWETVVALALFA
ncbi:hypothetical protein SpAn4DRAFT_2104 [Sporomusa ovata]|uniref:Uncharacterized protein n=1 Tax=Sporomusa ovata TaxID=2378 RepID=A0A0U1KUV2_9FIRM|nr:hypothetical protein SpAn4DRAFT_2104 [Sporomusa ovata]